MVVYNADQWKDLETSGRHVSSGDYIMSRPFLVVLVGILICVLAAVLASKIHDLTSKRSMDKATEDGFANDQELPHSTVFLFGSACTTGIVIPCVGEYLIGLCHSSLSGQGPGLAFAMTIVTLIPMCICVGIIVSAVIVAATKFD